MWYIGKWCFVVSVMMASGCHHCCWGKRASEECCPTDIRKGQFWCFGEDAIFHAPCGPKQEFYGHEPTCWRAWPVDAAEWRDSLCPGCAASVPAGSLIEDTWIEDQSWDILRSTPNAGQADTMQFSPDGLGRSGGPVDDEEASGFPGNVQGEDNIGGLPSREDNDSTDSRVRRARILVRRELEF